MLIKKGLTLIYMRIQNFGRTGLLFLFFGASLIACNNDKKEPDKVADKKNEENLNNNNQQDAKFLADAYGASLFEMNLSDNIRSITTDENVKSLATSMTVAHTDIDSQITRLAASKGISLPASITSAQSDKLAALKTKTQDDVNKDYVTGLIADRKDAISLFEKATADCTDPDIKEWFKNALPTLHQHLDMANACNAKLPAKKK